MTFGMMFGTQQNTVDDWSTDDDPDADYDEEDDEEEYMPNEYYDDMQPSQNNAAVDNALWEPQVKQYSNMNLKDEISKAREGDAKLDEEKRLKLAKKRAEKRKKQKEKKTRERLDDNDEDENEQSELYSKSMLDIQESVIPLESLEK